MQKEISVISKHLFNKDNPGELEKSEIENLILQYPYFAAARVLLAQNSFNDNPVTGEALITAGLFVHNPLRLNWLLNNPEDSTGELSFSLPKEEVPEQLPVLKDELADLPPAVPEEEVIDLTPVIMQNRIELADQPLSESVQEVIEVAPKTESGFNEPAERLFSVLEKEDIDCKLEKEEKNIPISFIEEVKVANGLSAYNTGKQQPEFASFEEENNELATEETVEEKQVTHSSDEFPIAFQSYHTIDYFASQGIRLQASDLTKDKFGMQLKSFTEWLRSMKKIPSAQAEALGHPDDDYRHQHVVQNAAHSIETKEIVTEAMAEVWAKQGNHDRAIAIYHKLSLQNTGKSGYFAAKIDQLKVK